MSLNCLHTSLSSCSSRCCCLTFSSFHIHVPNCRSSKRAKISVQTSGFSYGAAGDTVRLMRLRTTLARITQSPHTDWAGQNWISEWRFSCKSCCLLRERELLPTPERPLSPENVPRLPIAPETPRALPRSCPRWSLRGSAALGVGRPLRPARALCPSQRWHRFHLIAPRESGSLGICTELLLRLFPRGQRAAASGSQASIGVLSGKLSQVSSMHFGSRLCSSVREYP